jgi:hypothetical protein
MTTRTAARVVGVLLAAALAALAVGATFFALNRGTGPTDTIFSFADLFQVVAGAFGFLVAGAVVSTRRPGNSVGWLCLAIGLLGIMSWAATQYAAYGLVTHPGSLPGGTAIAVGTTASFAPNLVLVILIVVLFPDGHLLSRRWRLVPAAAIIGLGALYGVGLTNDLSAPFLEVENPLHTGSWVVGAVIAVSIPLALASVVGAFAGITTRFRRSRGDEREQLKWLAMVASIFPVGLVAHSIADGFAPQARGTVEFLFSFAFLALPVAIGIAILKYRLYEIDRIISRALVYGTLTVVLGASYVGLVLAGQALSSSLTGGGNLAIAVSTLLVAALFLPVRSRVQGFVDRRFYRRRYDAQRTLEGFGARLREQVDLQTLVGDLRSAVDKTMQPTHVALWLRGGRKP